MGNMWDADLYQKINRSLSWWNTNNSLLLGPTGQNDVVFDFDMIYTKYQTSRFYLLTTRYFFRVESFSVLLSVSAHVF